MRITCENCGENISIPNKKGRVRGSSNHNHNIITCRQCGHKNFIDVIARYNAKREDYTGEKGNF